MHRAGYVGGGVALRGVVSHRDCGAGPGPVIGLLACPSLFRSPRRSCCASSSFPWSCGTVWPYMQRSRPRSGGGGSSADPRCWSSVLRGSSPGGVLPVDTRAGVDRARPIGLEQVARASAGFEGAPRQRQHGAAMALHCRLGPGFHRKLHSWVWSKIGTGKRKEPPLGGGSSKTATELSPLTRMPPGPGGPVWRTKRCHRSAR